MSVACALLGVGYLLFYVAGSNLAHGPGHGVGFLEALGLSSAPPSSTTAQVPTGQPVKPQTKPGHPAGGGSQ